ncbi:hypothetical protein BST28156_00196 [Burkholderia stagnalis]|uniref:hypothetical protein n=1 Tax=Burkholderia stagnalis TaxID=1503054 RepID=UPI0014532DF8|nr:hypothetical protein BST28156_00196 [Burkholderia stagnalis]
MDHHAPVGAGAMAEVRAGAAVVSAVAVDTACDATTDAVALDVLDAISPVTFAGATGGVATGATKFVSTIAVAGFAIDVTSPGDGAANRGVPANASAAGAAVASVAAGCASIASCSTGDALVVKSDGAAASVPETGGRSVSASRATVAFSGTETLAGAAVSSPAAGHSTANAWGAAGVVSVTGASTAMSAAVCDSAMSSHGARSIAVSAGDAGWTSTGSATS